ncbi:hypothetical protein CPB83DRAFT_891879 [Crepidotus variabilis]|uniref:GST N-terminal domain-containing protein n=1 Tax=Crepidotus variabilis TaxID=179855 RepID=A0A9P6JT64_9AGAR|nr:hypothetical protein CPB83DRAFT_891879 [Crepidotus variabilis]
MTIIFYDIPSKLPGCAWSHNTWKTRFYLNYRRIPYKTEWIEYPDIKAFSLLHSIPPTTILPSSSDQEPVYTLPAIHDPLTGIYLADSLAIAEYLEEKYPESVTGAPTVFPNNTLGLQKAFNNAVDKTLVTHRLFLISVVNILNPSSEEYWRRTRTARLKVEKLEDAIPKGEDAEVRWATFESELERVAKWFLSESQETAFKFVMGNQPIWADIVVAAELIWMKLVWGAESDQWNEVARWDDGKWSGLLEAMEPYASTDK